VVEPALAASGQLTETGLAEEEAAVAAQTSLVVEAAASDGQCPTANRSHSPGRRCPRA